MNLLGEVVCIMFFDGFPTEKGPVLSHQNPVLREVLGDGGGIVLVERIGMFFNDRDKLLT